MAEVLRTFTPAGKKKDQDARVSFEIATRFVRSPCVGEATQLGALDAQFCGKSRHPAYVQFVLYFPGHAIDAHKFALALEKALASFPDAAKRRVDSVLDGNAGVRFSCVRMPGADLVARPALGVLWDPPALATAEGAEQLSVRVANADSEPFGASVGVCFDHALCDMGGAAVLLSHVSQHYASLDASPEPPCADRSKQALVVLEDEEEERESQDVQDGAKTRTGAALGTVSKLKGGCACVEWRYGSGVLAALKRSHAAHSRHDAVFAEALAVLREAGAPLATASIARDDRARGENVLPPQHFGNGSVLVEAQLLPPTEQSPTTPPTLLAQAVRAAVSRRGGFLAQQRHCHSDAHLVSWWHPLQRDLGFGARDPTKTEVALGPATVATAARLCALRGGQPNVTVLPAADGGLLVSLVAPTDVAGRVRRLLAARKHLGRTDEAARPLHPPHPSDTPKRAGAGVPAA